MTTPYGEFVRAKRRAANVLMLDMAKAFRVSAALLSSVETGRKTFPGHWRQLVIEYFRLAPEEIRELDTAIDRSRQRVSIDLSGADAAHRDAAIAFARNFDRLTPGDLRTIKGLMKKKD